MKRLFIALVLALTLMLGTAGNAMAAVTPTMYAPNGAWSNGIYSVAWDGAGIFQPDRKEALPTFHWSTQPDGSGVIAEFLEWQTLDGCNKLQGDAGNPAYNKVSWDWENQNGVDYGGNFWGDEPCNFDKNHDSVWGADNGPMVYYLRACEKIGVDRVWWRILLKPTGYAELLDKGHYSTDYCEGTTS